MIELGCLWVTTIALFALIVLLLLLFWICRNNNLNTYSPIKVQVYTSNTMLILLHLIWWSISIQVNWAYIHLYICVDTYEVFISFADTDVCMVHSIYMPVYIPDIGLLQYRCMHDSLFRHLILCGCSTDVYRIHLYTCADTWYCMDAVHISA